MTSPPKGLSKRAFKVVSRSPFIRLIVCLYAGILSHCGDHHAHFTRSGNQSEIVWSSHPRVLHGEVHVYGEVMRRGGEGGEWYCIDSVLKTPE